MTEREGRFSPLCREITQDGQTVYVTIYRNETGKWTLVVVDAFDNQTNWLEDFDSDQKALEEVYRTLLEEGIDVFVGSPLSFEDFDWPFTPV